MTKGNDLFYFLLNLCILYNYANDNTLSKNDKDVKVLEYKLSIASQTAIKWFKDNFIKAKAPKFQIAFFSRDNEIEGITINLEGVQLHSNECTKLLRTHVDRYLTFDHHVSELCRKAVRQVNCLMRLSTMLPVESKLTIFNAFIVSNFLYCPVVWHMCSKSDTKMVDKVQERALCFTYRKFESDYKSLLNLAERSSFYMDRLRTIITEVHQAIIGMSPECLQDWFVIKANVHYLRNNNKMKLYKFKTMTYGKHSIIYVAGIRWNSINVDIKNTDNVNVFKTKIRN